MGTFDDFYPKVFPTYGYTIYSGVIPATTKEEKDTFKRRVNKDILALGIHPFKTHHAELPPPPPELADTYDVAYSVAVRKCDHKRSATCMSYSRGEHQCDDCGRYFVSKGCQW